ncbi:MAG: cyclodeaminase/cyclohydrolase family protein [Mogibacterium sp.]|nr:cyclodeaminase/cyclohydrolase family protein [Mogibacterium sp.]
MDMLEMKINDFLDKLESADAVPGGGGASALAAALGSSLGTMVGSLTVGKKKYADVEEDIKALMAEMTELSDKLAACVNKDAELFAPLAEAYSIPKDAPGRDETLEKCLRDAASAPFEIMELCCRAIELLEEFAAKGSKLVVSDAATGAVLCKGAMLGAAINVRVNTRLMKDKEYAADMDAKTDALIAEYSKRAEAVFEGFFYR